MLEKLFPDASEKFNSSPTPFKSYSTFELYIEETLPATPAEPHLLKERYLVKSSAHIGKKFHILKYTRPDLMYTSNLL